VTRISLKTGKIVLRGGKVATGQPCCCACDGVCGTARTVCGNPCAVRLELDGVDQSLAECGDEAVIEQLGAALTRPLDNTTDSFVTTCNSTNFDLGRTISAIPSLLWSVSFTPSDYGGIVTAGQLGGGSSGLVTPYKTYSVGEARCPTYPGDGIGVLFEAGYFLAGRSQDVWLDEDEDSGYRFTREYHKRVLLVVQCRHGTPDSGFYTPRLGPPTNLNTTACSACGGTTGSPQWVLAASVVTETRHSFAFVTRAPSGNYVSQATRRTTVTETHSLNYSFSHASPILAALPCDEVLSHEADTTKRSFSDRDWEPSVVCDSFSGGYTGRSGREDFHLSEVSGEIGPTEVVVDETSYTPRLTTTTSRTSQGSGLPNPIAALDGNADFDVATQWPVTLATLDWQEESVPFRVYSTRCCDPNNYDSICNPLP
jgi:hypothetical protein